MKRILRGIAGVYLSLLVVLLGLAIFWQEQSFAQDVNAILQSSSKEHWLGTDSLGRDLWLRILQGGQISVSVGLITAFCGFCLGLLYGGVAGWFEGNTDRVLMRGLDIFMAIPSFVLVSVLCLVLQFILPIGDINVRAFVILCVAISLTHWMSIARVARGLVMETKRKPYIEASRALGAQPWRILKDHIFPNIRSRILILGILQIPTNIMYESLMSFIGLGVQPPWTSWGLLVRDGWKTLSAFPHLILYPSLFLFLTVWSFNILFDRE